MSPSTEKHSHSKAEDTDNIEVDGSVSISQEPSRLTMSNSCKEHVSIFFGLLDTRITPQLAKQYMCGKEEGRHAKRQSSEQIKLIKRLRQNSGRGAEDAYYQLEELHVI